MDDMQSSEETRTSLRKHISDRHNTTMRRLSSIEISLRRISGQLADVQTKQQGIRRRQRDTDKKVRWILHLFVVAWVVVIVIYSM